MLLSGTVIRSTKEYYSQYYAAQLTHKQCKTVTVETLYTQTHTKMKFKRIHTGALFQRVDFSWIFLSMSLLSVCGTTNVESIHICQFFSKCPVLFDFVWKLSLFIWPTSLDCICDQSQLSILFRCFSKLLQPFL